MSSSHNAENSEEWVVLSDELNLDTTSESSLDINSSTNLECDTEFDIQKTPEFIRNQVYGQKEMILVFLSRLDHHTAFIDALINNIENESQMVVKKLNMLSRHINLLENQEKTYFKESIPQLNLLQLSSEHVNKFHKIKLDFISMNNLLLTQYKDFQNEINEKFLPYTVIVEQFSESTCKFADLFKKHEKFCNDNAEHFFRYSKMCSSIENKFQINAANNSLGSEKMLNYAIQFRNYSIELIYNGEVFRLHAEISNAHTKIFTDISDTLKKMLSSLEKFEQRLRDIEI